MDRSDTRQCGCGSAAVRIVRGNDFTVKARLYVDDAGAHTPLDLSTVREVALGLVGPFSRIVGRDVSAEGNTVSAFFPAESSRSGTYGVEITFRDSKGKARLYERELVAVVESAADAGRAESAGRTVSVDINARVITLGWASYRQLPDKPSINGVELVGDRTSAELGLVKKADLSVVAASGSYNDLADKPRIPSRTSDLSNDLGFITGHQKLKTVNGESLIGEGNITIEGGGGSSITVDSTLSDSSANPVQNMAVKAAIDAKQDKGDYALKSDIPDIGGKADKTEIPDVSGFATKSEVERVEGQAAANAADILKKVDRVAGKGLSTNDYTDEEKAKVGKALTEHQSLSDYYTKEEVDNKVAQGGTFDPMAYYNRHDVDSFVDGKVDKIEGKQLSSNDYTDADKAKVAAALTEHQDIGGKQDAIADLDAIREGAQKGATALQSYTESDPVYTKDKPNIALKSDIPDTSGLVKKADLSVVATSGDYNDLSNKPSIPPAVTEQTVTNWGFAKKSDTYAKPSSGIPKSDLATAVQTSLGKADTALQDFTETDPTVPSWAKQPAKPSYTASEVGALPSDTRIPSKTSDLSNDSGFITGHQKLKTVNGQSLIGEGDITIEGGSGSSVTVDSALSDSSTNPVQNKAVKKAIDAKQDKGDYALKSEIPDVTGLAKKTDIPDISGFATKAEVSLVDAKADANAANILKKVDKVDGKGLSTNDYTDADKTKLGKALTEHQSLGNYYTKEEVDNKVAQGSSFDPTAYYNKHDVDTLVDGKVDKVEGKSLSTNDYTDADKAKVLAALTEHQDISGKQDVIADLEAIRSGAAKGETALQSYTESDPVYTKDKPNIALKSEIPDVSGLAKSSDLAEVATSGDYNDLSNRPSIPSAVTEQTVSGWGFTKNTGDYSKPSGGIPKSDLDSSVRTSLGKADTALQDFTETDPTVPSWAKQPAKPSYTASEVGALPSDTRIPSKTSDLSNDSGYITEHQKLKTVNGESLVGEGDITIEAAGAALTYDISPLVAKLTRDGLFIRERHYTLTSEELTAVSRAYSEGRLFLFPGGAAYPTYSSYETNGIIHITLSGMETNGTWDYDDRTYIAQISYRFQINLNTNGETECQLIEWSVPTVDYDRLAEDYIKPREVVKTNESTIGYGTSYSSTTPSVTLAADKFHIVGRVAGLSIALPDGSDTDGREYVCQFFVPYSTYRLTLPDTVSWLGGNVPAFEGNTCCMLSIVNHCAVIGVFKQS